MSKYRNALEAMLDMADRLLEAQGFVDDKDGWLKFFQLRKQIADMINEENEGEQE